MKDRKVVLVLAVLLTIARAASAAPHGATLSWNPVAVAAGYNIYRSAVSGSGYVKLNTALLATPKYVDTAVTGASKYFYVVTAVNAAGQESAFSAEISALIPLAPPVLNPPTNLQVQP